MIDWEEIQTRFVRTIDRTCEITNINECDRLRLEVEKEGFVEYLSSQLDYAKTVYPPATEGSLNLFVRYAYMGDDDIDIFYLVFRTAGEYGVVCFTHDHAEQKVIVYKSLPKFLTDFERSSGSGEDCNQTILKVHFQSTDIDSVGYKVCPDYEIASALYTYIL